jgi:hypothetical protein
MGPVRAPLLRVNGQNGLRSRAAFAREWAEWAPVRAPLCA